MLQLALPCAPDGFYRVEACGRPCRHKPGDQANDCRHVDPQQDVREPQHEVELKNTGYDGRSAIYQEQSNRTTHHTQEDRLEEELSEDE